VQSVTPNAACGGPVTLRCFGGTCDASGQCLQKPSPKGSPCPIGDPGLLSECLTGVCDGTGGCDQLVNVGAECGASWVGPCAKGVCQGDGKCLAVPAKPEGVNCSSACVVSGTCGANGVCQGKTKVGATCASANCASGSCSASGACVLKAAPLSTPCNFPDYVTCGTGQPLCDGQGRCSAALPPADGTVCGDNPSVCANIHRCYGGQCLALSTSASGSLCKIGCLTGTCLGGQCQPSSAPPSNSLSCDDGFACTEDSCCLEKSGCQGADEWPVPLGACVHKANSSLCPSPGPGGCGQQYCVAEVGCLLDTISPGICPKDSCGNPQFCQAGSCVLPNGPSACNDANPCTVDFCGTCGCSYSAPPSLEGSPCAKGGHCSKGNCLAD
jgi:hypothetical protein